jgi:hypothetical protein
VKSYNLRLGRHWHGAHRHARHLKTGSRFPQFYSRIGFIPEFRLLDQAQMRSLLNERWLPAANVRLPDVALAPDVIAMLIRMSGGAFGC